MDSMIKVTGKTETGITDVKIKLAITGICISLFMVNLDGSIVGIGLPTMIRQLSTTFAMGQWFVLIYMLVLTALVSAAGRLGDIFGKKRLYITGTIIFTIASLLCGFAGNGWSLLIARGIQGIGAAFILSLSVAIAAELTPSHQLGRIMGILSTVMALGIACGPTLGGILLAAFGWQSMFMVNIPFGIIACGLAYTCITTPQVVKYTRVDWIGIVLLVLILSCYCLSMTSAGHVGIANLAIPLALLAAAIAGIFVFVWFEQKITDPLVDISILKNSLISRNLLVTVLVATMIVTTIILPPFYLSGAAHMSSLETGLLMSFGPLLTVVLSIPAGRVADKYGAGKVIFASVLLMSVGCIAMSTVTPQQGIVGYLWRIGLIQLGFSFFKTPNNTIIMKAAQPDQRGLLSGFLSLSRILGQITGTAIMGLLFALFSGISQAGGSASSAGVAAITHSFDRIFLINGIITIIAALLIFPKNKQDN